MGKSRYLLILDIINGNAIILLIKAIPAMDAIHGINS